MLGISPITYNSKSHTPSFGYNKKDVDNDINFYKEQVEELDEFINENYIPDKMKKPFKFFRTIANGAIDGLAVFGSTLMLASFVKKSGAKLNSNKFVKNAVEKTKPLAKKVPEAVSFVKEKISTLFDKLLKSSVYQKFADTKLGRRIIADTSVLTVKGEDAMSTAKKSIDKAIEPIKNINSDKAVKGTATVLGIGSGITGAYETTMRDDITADVDEGFEDEEPMLFEEDRYYRESA